MPDVYAKTLVRAAEIAGGEVALAERFKVVSSHLHLWIRGVFTRNPPPMEPGGLASDDVT